jgi:quinol monooxygenase YgiN
MLTHVVMMKFKSGVEDSVIIELEKILEDLPNKITEIHSYEFGRDIVRSTRSYDFALVSLFANPEALERYRQHQHHQPVLKKIKQICETVATVDFYGSDAGSIDIERTGWDIKPI